MAEQRIYGIDFTSAPGPRKPLTRASASLEGDRLCVQEVAAWTNYRDFEDFLASPGPWICGLDLPFALPQGFLDEVGWPRDWQAATRHMGIFHRGASRDATHDAFRAFVKAYRDRQPAGKKHPKRRCDEIAGAVSPLMVFGVPVGLMLLEGAPRLLASGASIVPNRPNGDSRVVVEVYPGAGVRALGGRLPYKRDKGDTSKRQQRRRELLETLVGPGGHAHYGLSVGLADNVRLACLADFRGDALDAVLCAVQAAWAAVQLGAGWVLPEEINPNEGWIFDPALG